MLFPAKTWAGNDLFGASWVDDDDFDFDFDNDVVEDVLMGHMLFWLDGERPLLCILSFDDDNDVLFIASAWTCFSSDMDLHGVSLFGQWVPHFLHLWHQSHLSSVHWQRREAQVATGSIRSSSCTYGPPSFYRTQVSLVRSLCPDVRPSVRQ